MKDKIKKIIKKIQSSERQRKVMAISIAIIFCLSIILYRAYIVKAYPGTWDRYVQGSGILNTILNYEKSKMDLYESADTYSLVHNDSTDRYSDSGLVYYYGHGSSYQYTNTTIDTTQKWKSRWFLSGYGPFLDYVQNIDDGDAENISIQFAQDGDLYGNSDHIYVSQNIKDYSDSKSLASFVYSNNITSIPPLLINCNASTLSESIKSEARGNSIKNLVVLGGGEIYSTLFSVGEDFNIVRIGGVNRNDTFNLLCQTEKNKAEIYNVTNKPTVNDNGVVCDIKTDLINATTKFKIKSYLEENTDEGFTNAANLVLKDINYGNPTGVQSGSYQALIGCKDSTDSTKSRFLKVYFVKNIDGITYGVYQYMGADYFAPAVVPTPTGNITATLNAPSKVFVGDDVPMDGTGTDIDATNKISTVTGNIWVDTSKSGINGTNPSPSVSKTWDLATTNSTTKRIGFDNHISPVWFSETGIYKANSNVSDSSGTTDKSDIKSITAIYPKPTVRIVKTGTEKQNRKLTLDASTSDGGCSTANGNKRWPIDWTSATWQVKALGSSSMNDLRIQTHTAGVTNGTILYDPSKGITDLSKLNGLKSFDILSKNPNQYEFTLTLTSNCTFNSSLHFTSSKSVTVNIIEDAVPVINFFNTATIYRDSSNNDSSGFAQATENIVDDGSELDGSYSTDRDFIAKRAWLYAFDSDNDGSFTDESWYILENGSWRYFGSYTQAKAIIPSNYNCGNETNPTITGTHVGSWDIELIGQEEFGQEYIPQFVTVNDRKKASSFDN